MSTPWHQRTLTSRKAQETSPQGDSNRPRESEVTAAAAKVRGGLRGFGVRAGAARASDVSLPVCDLKLSYTQQFDVDPETMIGALDCAF